MVVQRRRTAGWILATAGFGVAVALFFSNSASEGQSSKKSESASAAAADKQPPAQKDRNLQLFMRKKLAASNQILEGLCTDDMNLVAEGARTLHEMSEAERWRVTNDVMYKQFSNEFRQITQDLIKAAEEDKADRATLKWLDATVSCLDCHRFVRGLRIVDRP
jgi:hypothetical protein